MENPLLENQLQDICSFRQAIINSNEKIQHRLLRVNQSVSQRNNPIQLISYCDCSNQKNHQNHFQPSPYEDKTDDYFLETDHTFNNKLFGPSSKFKDPYLSDYIDQYEIKNFAFDLKPFKERKDLQKEKQNNKNLLSQRKRKSSKKKNSSSFQNMQLNLTYSKNRQPKNQKDFFNRTLNLNRNYDNDFQNEQKYQTQTFRKSFKQNIALTTRKDDKGSVRNFNSLTKIGQGSQNKNSRGDLLNEIHESKIFDQSQKQKSELNYPMLQADRSRTHMRLYTGSSQEKGFRQYKRSQFAKKNNKKVRKEDHQ